MRWLPIVVGVLLAGLAVAGHGASVADGGEQPAAASEEEPPTKAAPRGLRRPRGYDAGCEMLTGWTVVDDYMVLNRNQCYSKKLGQGDYLACLRLPHPASCLAAQSQSRKRYLCHEADTDLDFIRCTNEVIRHSEYYPEKLAPYQGIDVMFSEETVLVGEGEPFPYDLPRCRGIIRDGRIQPKQVKRCVGAKPQGVRRHPRHNQLFLHYVSVLSCEQVDGGVEVTLRHIRIPTDRRVVRQRLKKELSAVSDQPSAGASSDDNTPAAASTQERD